MYTEKGAFGQSLVRWKGGQISESFSHGLKSPKMEETRGCNLALIFEDLMKNGKEI